MGPMDGWVDVLGRMGDADSRFAKQGELRLAVVMAMIPNDDHFWGQLVSVGFCSVWDMGDGMGGILRGDACVTRVFLASRNMKGKGC